MKLGYNPLWILLFIIICGCTSYKVAYVERPINDAEAKIFSMQKRVTEKDIDKIEKKWTSYGYPIDKDPFTGGTRMTWETFELRKATLDREAELKMFTQREYMNELEQIIKEDEQQMFFSGALSVEYLSLLTLFQKQLELEIKRQQIEKKKSSLEKLLPGRENITTEMPPASVFLVNDTGLKIYPEAVSTTFPLSGGGTWHAPISLRFSRKSDILTSTTKFIKMIVVYCDNQYAFEWNFTDISQEELKTIKKAPLSYLILGGISTALGFWMERHERNNPSKLNLDTFQKEVDPLQIGVAKMFQYGGIAMSGYGVFVGIKYYFKYKNVQKESKPIMRE
jgi:hypothetical protein